jgi:DinB superfamily
VSRSLADRQRVLAVLRETPARIAVVAEGVPEDVLQRAPGHGEWSAVEVLAHLRACADVWGDSVAEILNVSQPTIRAFNPQSWIEQTDYPGWAFAPSLQAFTEQRVALLAVLDALTPAQWERTALVTGAGAPLERTVHSYMDRMARHERPHVGQMARAISRWSS